MIIFICWLVFCHVVGKYAQKKNGNYWVFFLVSAIASPLVGFIVASIFAGKNMNVSNNTSQHFTNSNQQQNFVLPEQRRSISFEYCPNCGEKVLSSFSNCPHCGSPLR